MGCFLSGGEWYDMQDTDVNRRAVVFDRPIGQGKGLVGTIISVSSPTTFRFRTDPTERNPDGREYEFSMTGDVAVSVQFLEVE